MEERRRCTTVRQLELLIEFLEEHRDLALGRVRSKEARAVAARLWEECAEKLNTEGPFRTGKEWAKVWNDNKCRVRTKLVSLNASQRATGGGPSNAPILTPLEERVANILGRDIGPLADVRQNQFAVDNDDGAMVVEIVNVEGPQENILQNIQIAPSPVVLNEAVLHPETTVQVQPLPASPVPSVTGLAPSLQNSPMRTTERVRRVREQRRTERASRVHISSARTQHGSARSALEESRSMVLRIEEMRAEAALANAQAMSSFAESFRLIAESIERFSQLYCQTQNPQ